MDGAAARRSDKQRMILDHALDLLNEAGDAGLTMRRLAERAQMRLSNVQYYFKSRDAVLKAMVEIYFRQCADEIRALSEKASPSTERDRAKAFILFGLSHGEEPSDMCRIFRELWAISSRNQAVREHMADYYRTLATLIADFVMGPDGDPDARGRVAGLLMPFFEGYSVTAPASPLPVGEVAEMLTDLAMTVATPAAR